MRGLSWMETSSAWMMGKVVWPRPPMRKAGAMWKAGLMQTSR